MKNDKSFNLQLYSGDKEHKQKKKKEKRIQESLFAALCFFSVQKSKHLPGKSWMYQGADHIHSVWKLC